MRKPVGTSRNFILSLLLLVALAAGCGGTSSTSPSAPPRVVPCSDLTTLRHLNSNLTTILNPSTGDTIEYVVVGDGAVSDDLIVMFPGTAQILPDWPMQMITNSTYSPKITSTAAYDPTQDGPISLCHDYRLLMFDYPGVGKTKSASGVFQADTIANDVDAIVNDAGGRFDIPTGKIDPMGWSLGTETALKYAFLSPAGRPERTIQNVLLVATRPGGDTDPNTDFGNQAACVTTLFDILETRGTSRQLTQAARKDAFELIFPFVGQAPFDGIDSGCTATVDTANNTIGLSVTPNCPTDSECAKSGDDAEANRLVEPWVRTNGVDRTLLIAERSFEPGWNVCYCAQAQPGFTSSQCSCSGKVTVSETDGGVCQTQTSGTTTVNEPIATNCATLNLSGKLTVINGYEDLFVQWTYGAALVQGMQQVLGADRAVLDTYPGSDGAGHGVMLQHPRWTQEQLFQALQN